MYRDKEKKRIYDKKWFEKNYEHKCQQQREYYHKNKEKRIEKSKEWGKQNKEHLKKYREQFLQKTKWLKLLPLYNVSKKETHLYF